MNGEASSRVPRSASPWHGALLRIGVLLRKELAQIRRDRTIFGLLIIAPVVQLMVMGYASTTDITGIRLAVRDNDHSWHSRELVRAVSSSRYFETTPVSGAGDADARLLLSGEVSLILVIPEQFGEDQLRRRPAQLQALVDGADSNFAVQGLNYLNRAIRRYSLPGIRAEEEALARRSGIRLPAVEAECRAWFNPDLTSRHYMVPAIMGVLLMVVTMIVTSMALVKEREQGTMEQLIVTPLRPAEIIAGKLLPFVVIGFVEVTLAIAVTRGVFAVPLRGRLIDLYLFSGLFLLTTLGLGLLVSTLVHTQQQAMLVSAFFVMMPFVLLSGFIFPVENMPAAMQAAASLIPLKYYLTAVRALFLKGCGWTELWPQALALLGLGAAILTTAVLKFHKRLD